MKTFFIVLSFILAIILQTSSIPFLTISKISPDLVLVLILLLVILKKFEKVWWIVVIVSLLLDLFSSLPFGLISFSLVITVYLIGLFNRNMFSAVKFWITMVLVVLATLTYNLVLIILSQLFILVKISPPVSYFCGLSLNCWLDFMLSLAVATIYNLLMAAILFYGVKKIFHQE